MSPIGWNLEAAPQVESSSGHRCTSAAAAEMRAHDVLDALERVTLFRAQAADSNRRLEDIGSDLDSAISLLDLQQQQCREAEHPDGAATGVTQGVHRAVLDWSTGVIVKLAAALPKHATIAASTNVSTTTTSERHARNARRWLSDPRIWRCFVRSLRGGATQAAEPSTHLPQAASLGVLRAAIFAVRAGAPGSLAAAGAAARAGDSCSASPQAAEPNNDGVAAAAAAAGAGDWAFVAVLTLCGGVIVTAGGGGGRGGGQSSGSMTSIDAAVLDELRPRRADGMVLATAGPAAPAPALATVASKRWGGGGAVMKMSLDAYATFLDEVLRGHEAVCLALPLAGDGAGSGGRSSVGGKEAAAVATAGGGALPSLAEGALTELLRFQVVLQAQQTSPRKVFTTFCSKLMGSLFRALPPEISTTASASSPLKTAAKAVAFDALFHEEHLEGYREAFTAAEEAVAAAVARTGSSPQGGGVAPTAGGGDGKNISEPDQSGESGGGGKKRRRKNTGREDGGGDDGGKFKKPRSRVCYQQQLLDEMAALAAGSRADGEGGGRSRLGAVAGAPILLEGFILRLGKVQRGAVDIHEASGAATAAVAVGGKRSRSSGGSGGGGSGSGSSASPASQMFRLWSVLHSTLLGSLPSAPSSSPPPAQPSDGTVVLPRLLLLPFLRSSNSMLRLLAEHDVYRINEDWGGLEFGQLRSFSSSLIRLAESCCGGGGSGGGGGNSTDGGAPASTPAAMAVSRDGARRTEDAPDAPAAAARVLVKPTKEEVTGAGAAAEEFLRAFGSLLGLNHSILHDDLRQVLRMTFEWAATAETAESATAAPGTVRGGDGGSGGPTVVLRALAVDLVASLVGTGGGGGNSTDGGAPASTPAAMAVSRDGARRTEDAPDAPAAAARVLVKPTKEEVTGAGAAAEEFLRAFGSLLGLNHSILHDDLRQVLRMTFEWAATAETAESATAAPGTVRGGDGGSGGPTVVLRALAVDLVASLVGTYGRLRQMDHLVRALFGAVSDCPQAAAAMLRRDECAAALGRAFRRLPEGQIAPMWDVFAAHLREGWNQGAGCGGGGGGGGGRNDLLAREMDAELFVVFVRNLHVTSSVASAVGALCSSLAEESLRSFGVPLRQAAAAAAAASAATPSPPASKKKKKQRRGEERAESEQHGALGDGSGSGGVPMSEMMLSFRPALDVHGWLLDLDTRCRFWFAVLDSSSSATAGAGAAIPQDDGNTLVEEGGDGDKTARATTAPAPPASVLMPPDGDEADASLPRIIAAATAALETSSSSGGGGSSSLEAGTGAHDEEVGVRSRLEKTLQQVAVHRVQQIYAHLNGVAALESSGTTGAAERRPASPPSGAEGMDDDQEGKLEEAAPGGAAREEGGEEKLEDEARGLVAYACGACRGSGGGGHGPVTWGDEDGDGRGGGAGWSMMMPYLPVWVGFAEEEQVGGQPLVPSIDTSNRSGSRPPYLVALFLEALLSRCAADILDGRGEEESPPLRLLSDASFYEMEAVAKSAPAVILARVFHAVRRAVGGARGTGDKKESGSARLPPGFPAVGTIVAAVQALATAATTTANEKGKGRGGAAEGSSSDSPAEVTGGGEAERKGRDKRRQQEEELLEACCLLMMTERFPSGFLDEEAIAAMLVASDALDTVLARSLSSRCGSGGGIAGGGGGKKPADGDAAALLLDDHVPSSRGGLGSLASPASAGPREESLVEAVAALRRLSLRLGRSLPPESPLLERLPQGDALLRAIEPAAASGERGGESSRAHLLRASASLLPFLAERCVLRGDTKTALKAIVGLGLIKPRPASGGGEAEKRRRKRGHHPRKDAPPAQEEEDEVSSSRRLVLLHGVLSGFVAGESFRLAKDAAAAASASLAAATSSAEAAMELDSDDDDDGLGGAVEGGGSEPQQQQPPPPSAAALDQRLVATVSHLAGCLPVQAAARLSTPTPTPPPVSPPLLLVWSDALRLSFLGPDAQRLVFADRKPGGAARSRSRWVEDCVAYLADRAERSAESAAMPSERSACCHLVRAVCGCSHLLDPPLPRLSVRRLVEAFVGIIDVPAAAGGGGGDYVDRDGAARRVQRAEEDLVLHTAFCLLVQHASEAQLDEIVTTLLEMLQLAGDETAKITLPAPPGPGTRPTAVTLLRLATRAGRGAAFKAVMPRRALSLAAALCRELRGAATAAAAGGVGNRLREATGALEALEGLLDRQPYSSVTARVVSVVLGSIEPAVRAAIDATVAVAAAPRDGGGSREAFFVVRESLRCFRATCRVVGTVLQHYARKVYSCTPPFASLCRSLLRLFFRLATAPAPGGGGGGGVGSGAGGDNATRQSASAGAEADAGDHGSHFAVSMEEQVAAASVFSRVLEQFVPHKEVLKKYAAFLLLEYVSLAGAAALEPAPRAALLSGVFAVMQACSRREMRQLHGLLLGPSLPTGTGQQVFRALNEEYQLQHKYVGKM
ncbi:unnamed protein product [Ectocarpus sp. CCAP 1310/34]|nr:unnamed protein product [Ectocarpus sp. CCAP 1310/34]